ncbi:DNA-directed DNA polymerase II small subunit [Halomarina pelagica]|uniref:DNA-directed DNA polymerase II small subunit n=1 Tax=Halomarina pelagica TaxID=2961599 RepID=UPI0020C3706E|nr:DNA-directed DNA polymerase II small subunit [Halomarina sp. BND7]
MPLETPRRIVGELASRGYNAEREAVTLLSRASDPAAALERALEAVPEDALKLSADHVRTALDSREPASDPSPPSRSAPSRSAPSPSDSTVSSDSTVPSDPSPPSDSSGPSSPSDSVAPATPSVSGGESPLDSDGVDVSPVETRGSARRPRTPQSAVIAGDVTGRSTGTGEYGDFVKVFRDRYERLSRKLTGRVNHRPTTAVSNMPGGEETALIGMINDVRSTASGHWLVELEDTNGVFPCLVLKDKPIADLVEELLLDEVIAVEGTLSGDGGVLFVDSLHFPDVPRTHRPNTADRHVQAALVSDVHVGSQEFLAEEWSRFAAWLHTEEAEAVEYLLLAGDMVEGVGVYPNQDEELSIVDIYEQYEAFSEYLKEVPGDVEIVMIPGNHDAVRLAEPQPAFDEELREIMSAHDARITGNPSTVTVEGVNVLMYHGVSLDEVIAELPEHKASYDEPHLAMYQLLKKRHVAPQYGGHTRLAPEERDYLVVDDVPDIFHTGHVHKLGYGKYHNVLAINSGCWQAQTDFQRSVNIDPDHAYAPIVDLDTLKLTIRDFN